MRKLLSVILAITMVFSTVAFALPSAVIVTDDAMENSGEKEDASLMANANLARGINLFTGTKDAFDGDNYSDFSSWLKEGTSGLLEKVTVTDDPSGVRDKVLQFEYPAGLSNGYPNFYFDFGGDLDTDIGHPYVYFAYDYQKYVADTSGYTESNSFWMLNTVATSGDFAPINHAVSANDGWVHFGKVMDLSVNSTGYSICDPTTNKYYSNQDINKKLIFQISYNTENTVPSYFLFDNLVFAPAYKVTYYNAAGTNVVNEEFVVVDEEGNLLSSFAPETLLSEGKAYSGWSLSKGGSVVSEVALTENADIVLYATNEVDVFGTAKVVLDKKLTKKGDKATATAVFTTDVNFDNSKVTWSVADTDVAIVNYDKDKGLATITAMGAGTTEITFNYDGTSFTDTITVADGPVVATGVTSGAAISAFAGLDLDVYEYVTFNVTNTSGSAKTITLSLNDANTGSDIGFNYSTYEVTVPAGANGMDVYFDLSDEAAWTGNVESLKATFSGVTVNNAKLWAELQVENGIGFEADKNLITEAGDTATINVFCSSDLEGVYGEEYIITVEADSSATYTVNGNTVKVTAVSGQGSATIKVVSNEDASVKAEKEILIRVVEGKGIGYKWDFNNASNTGFTFSGRYTGSAFNGSTANVIAATAVLPGTTEAVPVELSSGRVDGKNVTIVKTYENLYGTMSTSKISSQVSVEKYPYLVIKARANSAKSHKLGIYMGYTNHGYDESKRKLTPDISLTTEWKTLVIDASESAALAPGEYFTGMMFSTNQNSLIKADIIKTNGSQYYIEGDVQYENLYNIEIDEMYFANYDPTKIYYGVSLKADKTSLDGDGIITLYPEVFGSDVVANDGVNYSVDKEGYVSILKNSDGTATVTPLKNGTVTITAASVMDATATDSITLTFSNIPTKTVAYDLKLMLIGNSYLEHAYLATADKTLYNGYLDKNDVPRGMAATSPELDYYARLCHYLTEGFEGTFTAKKQGGAVIEQAWKQGLASGTPSDLTGWDREKSLDAMKNQWKPILDYMDREQPNLITIQLAENAAHAYEESAEFFYTELFKVIDEHRPENSIVVIISPMGSGPSPRVQSRIAANYGFYWADNTWIGDEYGWGPQNPYLAFQHYPDYTNAHVVEFRTHPGNLGMDEIAKSAYAIFAEQIPTTIPATLVTVPEELEILGNTEITTAGGVTKLEVDVTPATATPGVIWSVDNEYLASVDETGLVTAKLNGTVTVTATSAYDETVSDTHTITISGQTQHYTLTYAAGTSDKVEGLPESFEYAAGNYEFPELVAPPERNGYKFLGWSEQKNGEVQTSVEMTGAKTVYAVWAFADNWNFDKDGDLEGIMVAGFNTAVKDGKMSTISYDGIAVGFSDETLLLNAAVYKSFKANISMSTVNEGDKFTLTIINDKGEKKTFETATLVGANDYTFKLDGVEGTITGFTLFTSNDADGVGMTVDSIKFVKTELRTDVEYDELVVTNAVMLEAGDKLVTVNNLTGNGTLHLAPGSYVIENNNSTVDIQASVNANVVIKNGTKPEGYVEINIGAANGATRYAEINGNEYEITSDEAVYGLFPGDETLLVEISTATESRYFLVKDGAAAEVPMGNYSNDSAESEIKKVEGVNGAKFVANVANDFEKSKDYTITEHGFIIGLEETINNNGGQLNFELTNNKDGRLAYVSGKAYARGEINKIINADSYEADGAYIFAGVLKGAPKDQYGKRLVIKTYTKVSIDGNDYVVYGHPMVESFYSLAKKLQATGDLSAEAQAIVDEIIADSEDMDNDLGLDGDDLWG